MRVLVWGLRGLVLFVLFAFALNNRAEVIVHGFFGHVWQAPLVIVVLAAFAVGCAVGIVAMTPAWWHRRRVAQRHVGAQIGAPAVAAGSLAGVESKLIPSELGAEHPPRDGL